LRRRGPGFPGRTEVRRVAFFMGEGWGIRRDNPTIRVTTQGPTERSAGDAQAWGR